MTTQQVQPQPDPSQRQEFSDDEVKEAIRLLGYVPEVKLVFERVGKMARVVGSMNGYYQAASWVGPLVVSSNSFVGAKSNVSLEKVLAPFLVDLRSIKDQKTAK
jgi:hypothetical protein